MVSLGFGLALAGLWSGAAEPSKRNLSLLIEQSGWGETAIHAYPRGKPIAIKCIFKNVGNGSVALFLKDHDVYHGTLACPVGTYVRVTNSSGQVITQSNGEADNGGWWNPFYRWSTTFDPEMPGDVILIPPGKTIVRKVLIDRLIEKAPGFGDGLKIGIYTVQIRMGGVLSNEIEISIVDNHDLGD